MKKKTTIISYNTAKKIARTLRKQKKTIVFKTGCFDILHLGHAQTLAFAKSLGDVLFVGVGSDETLRALKGQGRPIFPASYRARLLSYLRSVDYVVVLDEPLRGRIDHEQIISLIRPHLYVLPKDDKALKEKRTMAKKYGITIKLEPRESTIGSAVISTTYITQLIKNPGQTPRQEFEQTYGKELMLLKNEGRLVDDWTNVYHHCLTEGFAASVLSKALDLSDQDSASLIKAALLHDWYKRNEREAVQRLGSDQYDVKAKESAERLRKLGYPEETVSLTRAVGHTSLVHMRMQPSFLEQLIHYLDDITFGERIVGIDERINGLETAERYKELNESGKALFDGKTYFQIQREVGHQIEQLIALRLNTKPEEVIPFIKRQIETTFGVSV